MQTQIPSDSCAAGRLRRRAAGVPRAMAQKVCENFLELIRRWVHVLARSVQLRRAKSHPLFGKMKQDQIYPALYVIRS